MTTTALKHVRPDPYVYAETLGVRVIHRDIEANGFWVPAHRLVVLRKGMGEVKERCTLAHELAHMVLGHEDSNPLNEWQADRYASTHQIGREDFLFWWPRCGTVREVAARLEVTPKLVLAFAGMVSSSAITGTPNPGLAAAGASGSHGMDCQCVQSAMVCSPDTPAGVVAVAA